MKILSDEVTVRNNIPSQETCYMQNALPSKAKHSVIHVRPFNVRLGKADIFYNVGNIVKDDIDRISKKVPCEASLPVSGMCV